MSNVRAVYERLLSHGLQPHQAAAVVGRFQQESGPGLNPSIVGDGGMSVGIGQWNRERLANLKRFGGPNWQDPLVQADFFVAEGKGPEARAFSMIKNAKTLEEAARGAMAYERPQGFTWNNPTAGHGYANTLRNAQAIAGGNMPAALSPAAQDFVLNNPQPGGFGPNVPDPNNPSVFGSMSPGGKSFFGGGDNGIDPNVANYAFGDEPKNSTAPWEALGDAFKGPEAPRISGAFGGDARQSGDALLKLMQNPQALAQLLMKKRMA